MPGLQVLANGGFIHTDRIRAVWRSGGSSPRQAARDIAALLGAGAQPPVAVQVVETARGLSGSSLPWRTVQSDIPLSYEEATSRFLASVTPPLGSSAPKARCSEAERSPGPLYLGAGGHGPQRRPRELCRS